MISKNVRNYCCDDITLIENYDKAINDTKSWELHHRLETHDKEGKILDNQIAREELISKGLYYNRPSEELIFLPISEHRKLHMVNNQHAKGKNIGNTNALGNHLSEKTRQKMGQSRQGNTNNGIALIRCIETNKILRTREWIKEGFTNAYAVAKGYQKSCKGYHFEYVN